MTQSEEMLAWGGDNWLKRNKSDLGKRDPVTDLLGQYLKADSLVLEIGCANGWRLKKLRDLYGCDVVGIEPSQQAVEEARKFGLSVVRSTASELILEKNQIDVVIMGFCLWIIEPREWFQVVAESDRVLKDGGLLVIHDYISPRPWRKTYNVDAEAIAHGNVWQYFYDWPKLWLCHPAYSIIAETLMINNYEGVCIMRKTLDNCMRGAIG